MKKYLTFLRSLLKDRPYVKFVYMTGILPIAKYSSGSELNMFAEYTMAGEERFLNILDLQSRKWMSYMNDIKREIKML